MNPLYLHTWTFRESSLQEALQKASALPWDGVEIFGPHLSSLDSPAPLQDAGEWAEQYGVSIKVAPLRFSPADDHARPSPQVFEALAARIPELSRRGIRHMNSGIPLGDGSAPLIETHEIYAELFRPIMKVAQNEGVRVTFETHLHTAHETGRQCRQFLEVLDSPNAGGSLDFVNLVRSEEEETPAEAIEVMGEKLFYCHLKNCVPADDGGVAFTTLESGDMDYSEVYGLLTKSGFAGPLCIEYSGGDDPELHAEEDYRFMKRLMDA